VADRKRVLKSIRNVTISIVALLVLVIGAGVAYTWWMGKHSPAVSTVDDQAVTVKPSVKPVQPAENTPVGVSVQTITSPANPGMNASITIKTKPGATCTITVMYNAVASKDSGLRSKVADDFGVAMWTWTIEPTVEIGKWPVTVTCAKDKKSGVVISDLIVEKPEQ
jgi:hypothetical protein